MSARVGDPSTGEIVTFTGRIIKPLDPDPGSISIEDIAHSLAHQCRFTGHTREFYSVAQHSVLVSEILPLVPLGLRLAGLMHDASEAYLSDISRPVKHQPQFGDFYKEAEDRLMAVIAQRFGFAWPLDPIVHWADDVLLRSEQRDLMPDVLLVGGDDYLSFRIVPLLPGAAKRAFLRRYHELLPTEGTA